ncbi:MAG TPA: response regulator transcription factor [Puia sp.]|nr:response regulator transcription factor [Puia sp.]
MQNKLLIADDHSMTRKGLKLLVENHIGKERVQEVWTCNQLMNELQTKTYTHLILDIFLSDGSTLEVIPTIRGLYPELEILIFSMQPISVYERALFPYRVRYFISKAANEVETLRMIGQFLTNQRPMAPISISEEDALPFSGMPAREMDVLHYLLKGWKTTQIADTLNLSVSTVSTLKSRIFERTRTKNVIELMELANIHNVN